jgi:uncharacterized protein YecE (DUF72 family)
MSGSIRIGTSGFSYPHWKGDFYPADLPPRRWFEHYAAYFDTVELNNTFYRLPSSQTFRRWRLRAPAGFCFAVKYSRYGSHVKRLKAPVGTARRFLSRARHLIPSLGPILVQLPPHWDVQPDRLEGFLAGAPAGCRWAVEVRDPRWLCQPIYAILARHRAALCIHDLIPDHPPEITAGWTYLRFHGQHYGGSYPSEFLRTEAQWIAALAARGLDVYAYFNNDIGGHAIRNARELRGFLGLGHAGRSAPAGCVPEAA